MKKRKIFRLTGHVGEYDGPWVEFPPPTGTRFAMRDGAIILELSYDATEMFPRWRVRWWLYKLVEEEVANA